MKLIVIAFSIAFGFSEAKASELAPQHCIGKVCIKEENSEHEEYLKKVLATMKLAFSVKNTEG